MDCSLQHSSVLGTLQARIMEWAAISSYGGFPYLGIKPTSLLHCRQIFYHWATEGALFSPYAKKNKLNIIRHFCLFFFVTQYSLYGIWLATNYFNIHLPSFLSHKTGKNITVSIKNINLLFLSSGPYALPFESTPRTSLHLTPSIHSLYNHLINSVYWALRRCQSLLQNKHRTSCPSAWNH